MSDLIKKIVSGGQTGVDRASLDYAIENSIPHGGWCPKGRGAEDGALEDKYQLTETESEDVSQRTEWNVRDSDGTLLLTPGKPQDGTILTIECALQYQKPILILQLDSKPAVNTFQSWIKDNGIETLNIAGPRESHAPGQGYSSAKLALTTLIPC